MSDPIRRVGGPGVGPADAAAPAGESGDAFRAALDATQAVAPGVAAGASDAASLGAAIRSGQLAPSAAVELLVEKALSAPAARSLSESARADLERVLRAALAEDPTLVALQADLGRR